MSLKKFAILLLSALQFVTTATEAQKPQAKIIGRVDFNSLTEDKLNVSTVIYLTIFSAIGEASGHRFCRTFLTPRDGKTVFADIKTLSTSFNADLNCVNEISERMKVATRSREVFDRYKNSLINFYDDQLEAKRIFARKIFTGFTQRA